MHNSKNLDHVPIIIVSNCGDKKDLMQWGADDFYFRQNDFRRLIGIMDEIRCKWIDRIDYYELIREISFQ